MLRSVPLSALVDDFADGSGDGGAADRRLSRTIGAKTKGAARGIAMDNLDEIARHAEHVADWANTVSWPCHHGHSARDR
jgi:hypothetical protein